MAGEVAQNAVHLNDSSVRVLKEYETRWHNSFGKINKGMYKVKEFRKDLSDNGFNKLIRVFKDMQPQMSAVELLSLRSAWSLLATNPKLLFLVPHLSVIRKYTLFERERSQ